MSTKHKLYCFTNFFNLEGPTKARTVADYSSSRDQILKKVLITDFYLDLCKKKTVSTNKVKKTCCGFQISGKLIHVGCGEARYALFE